MAKIWLVRHGQASFGKEDYDQLSDLGKRQCIRLGEALFQRDVVPSKVILGTMLRHQQSCENALAAYSDLDVSIETTSNWNEYSHQEILGALDERLATPTSMRAYLKTFTDPKSKFAQLFNQAITRWMSGDHDADYPETWQQFKGRVSKGLEQVLSLQDKNKDVFVFTSGGPISAVMLSLMNIPESHFLSTNWTLVNGGLTKLVKTNSRLFVSSANEHSHFEANAYSGFITYK